MKVRFVSGPTTMPVTQNTPRIPNGIHHAFTKWKMTTLTREAAPTATTDSRIEIGIGVTMLDHLKSLPNQPASNRIRSAHLRRGDRVGRSTQAADDTPAHDSMSYRRHGSVFPRERSSL